MSILTHRNFPGMEKWRVWIFNLYSMVHELILIPIKKIQQISFYGLQHQNLKITFWVGNLLGENRGILDGI